MIWQFLLILLLAPTVASDSFVYRICLTDEDVDVVMHETSDKADADMCAWVVSCASAEVRIRLDQNAARTFWRSYSPERCRR